jgi:hypothetical protein
MTDENTFARRVSHPAAESGPEAQGAAPPADQAIEDPVPGSAASLQARGRRVTSEFIKVCPDCGWATLDTLKAIRLGLLEQVERSSSSLSAGTAALKVVEATIRERE